MKTSNRNKEPMFHHPAQPLTNTKQRSDYVLGLFRGDLWIGVRFGSEWQPARKAHASDIRYFN